MAKAAEVPAALFWPNGERWALCGRWVKTLKPSRVPADKEFGVLTPKEQFAMAFGWKMTELAGGKRQPARRAAARLVAPIKEVTTDRGDARESL